MWLYREYLDHRGHSGSCEERGTQDEGEPCKCSQPSCLGRAGGSQRTRSHKEQNPCGCLLPSFLCSESLMARGVDRGLVVEGEAGKFRHSLENKGIRFLLEVGYQSS